MRVAVHLAATCSSDLTVKASSRQLATATGLARDKVQRALDTLACRGLITIREGTATRAAAYRLNFGAIASIGGCGKQPPPGSQQQPGLFQQPGGGFLPQPPPTENTGLAGAPSAVDKSFDSIGLLDRVLTAKKSHHDKRDLAELRQWVDGYWAKLGALLNPTRIPWMIRSWPKCWPLHPWRN